MLMVAGRAQVPGSTWTSGSPALRSSSSGLGPRRLPSWDPLSKKAEKACGRYVTRACGFQSQVPGREGWAVQVSTPRESHPNPDFPPGAVWKLAGDRAHPGALCPW